jgi:hypothetical protein
MDNLAFATFLRHLPPELQEGLSFKTLGGTEITLQIILRIDHEFVALKGRLAGTQDAGRVFFVPYNQIDHFYYQKEVREEDFNAAFESLRMPDPAGAAVAAAPAATAAPEAPASESADSVPVDRPTPVPIRSAVLERFRSRSGPPSNPNITRPTPG